MQRDLCTHYFLLLSSINGTPYCRLKLPFYLVILSKKEQQQQEKNFLTPFLRCRIFFDKNRTNNIYHDCIEERKELKLKISRSYLLLDC